MKEVLAKTRRAYVIRKDGQRKTLRVPEEGAKPRIQSELQRAQKRVAGGFYRSLSGQPRMGGMNTGGVRMCAMETTD